MTEPTKTSNFKVDYLGKVTLEVTPALERVIKVEARTHKETGVISIALVQSVRVNSSGLPYQEPPRVRDILVTTPAGFIVLASLFGGTSVWERVCALLTPDEYKMIFGK